VLGSRAIVNGTRAAIYFEHEVFETATVPSRLEIRCSMARHYCQLEETFAIVVVELKYRYQSDQKTVREPPPGCSGLEKCVPKWRYVEQFRDMMPGQAGTSSRAGW
jgi:hypothetical protein